VDGASGIVLVLVPGGAFRMGAADSDERAMSDERPVHEVRLDPFLVSAFEVTQAQYSRWTGRNPSGWGPDTAYVRDHTHPVENLSWYEAQEFCARLGLALPTEAQWEYAARGGTDTPWWTGADRELLAGAVNLADGTAARDPLINWARAEEWPEYEDGYVMHAPVDAFAPNPFGLHNVGGNVSEWCLDRFGDYAHSKTLVPGTGERLVEPPSWRVLRGGDFESGASETRASYRNCALPESREYTLGLRPVRTLQGDWGR
jgi:formylglycine-generating enzyme required for sulfatase activity